MRKLKSNLIESLELYNLVTDSKLEYSTTQNESYLKIEFNSPVKDCYLSLRLNLVDNWYPQVDYSLRLSHYQNVGKIYIEQVWVILDCYNFNLKTC